MVVPNRILLITVHYLWYPVGVDVLQQVFASYGALESIEIHQASPSVPATVKFVKLDAAIKAKEMLHDRFIYDGCCSLTIRYSHCFALPTVSASSACYEKMSSMDEELTEDVFLSLEKSVAKLSGISHQNDVLDSLCRKLQHQSLPLVGNSISSDISLPNLRGTSTAYVRLSAQCDIPSSVSYNWDSISVPDITQVPVAVCSCSKSTSTKLYSPCSTTSNVVLDCHSVFSEATETHQRINEVEIAALKEIVKDTSQVQLDDDNSVIKAMLEKQLVLPAFNMINPEKMNCDGSRIEKLKTSTFTAVVTRSLIEDFLPVVSAEEYVDISPLFQHDDMDANGLLLGLIIAIFFILVFLKNGYTCILWCWRFFCV